MKERPYGEGPLDCDIMFVGEAPGREEYERRRPFVGMSSKIVHPRDVAQPLLLLRAGQTRLHIARNRIAKNANSAICEEIYRER